jgi:WD40 repeat protein
VKFVKWHPSKDMLFSASYDNSIKCWKYEYAVDDWICNYTLEGHMSTVWQLDFNSSGDLMGSCSEDKSWAIWRVQEGGFMCKGIIPDTHLRSVFSISWFKSPLTGDQLICTGGGDNRINVF